MFGSTVLDIGIGLVLTYLLLALIVTTANEFVASLFQSRARDLERGIRNLLDGTSRFPERWWQQLWGWMCRDKQKPTGENHQPVPPGENDKPNPTAEKWSDKFFAHQLIYRLSKDGQKPSYVPSQTFATALMQLVKKAANADRFTTFQEVRLALQNADTPAKTALLALVDEAETDLTDGVAALKKINDQIEIWYDHAMDRVSGWYKKRTQWVILAISVAFTVALNVDTLAIAKQLSKDGMLREIVVKKANAQAATGIPAPSDSTGAGTSNSAPGAGQFTKLEDQVNELKGIGIPVGWSVKRFDRTWPSSARWYRIAAKALGLLLTALAISLGAPFWFDVLNKFISIRSVGRAPDERPRDPKKVLQAKDPKATP